MIPGFLHGVWVSTPMVPGRGGEPAPKRHASRPRMAQASAAPHFDPKSSHQSIPVSGQLMSSLVVSGSIPNNAETCSNGGLSLSDSVTDAGRASSQKTGELGFEPIPNREKHQKKRVFRHDCNHQCNQAPTRDRLRRLSMTRKLPYLSRCGRN